MKMPKVVPPPHSVFSPISPHSEMMKQSKWRMTNLWKNKVNLIPNRYPNQNLLPIQETSTPKKQASNLLSTNVELVQPILLNHVELEQIKHVYIFPKILTTYAQQESLKQITLFFEQITLIVQTWFQIVNSLANMKSEYNNSENLIEDTK